MHPKHASGLRHIDATSIHITNHDTSTHSIQINDRQIGYQDIALGPLEVTANSVKTRDPNDNIFYEVLTTNSEIVVQDNPEDNAKVAPGQLMIAGNNLNKQQSPAPFAYIDTSGKLNSANLWTNLFNANVMGFVDIDKPDTYAHGLVPAGDADHQSLFLRKDGQWGMPSAFTGSVADTFLSLQDTPLTYTSNLDAYLRVSFAEGGRVVFDQIDTSKVPEDTSNLYYTDARVDTRMATTLSNNTINNININGTLTANDVETDSDLTLKTHITPIPPSACLATVNRLHPKQYQFKDSDKIRYGLIAQEVMDVLPHIVRRKDTDTLALSYLELIPFLIGSIQTLTARIKSLESQHTTHTLTTTTVSSSSSTTTQCPAQN